MSTLSIFLSVRGNFTWGTQQNSLTFTGLCISAAASFRVPHFCSLPVQVTSSHFSVSFLLTATQCWCEKCRNNFCYFANRDVHSTSRRKQMKTLYNLGSCSAGEFQANLTCALLHRDAR